MNDFVEPAPAEPIVAPEPQAEVQVEETQQQEAPKNEAAPPKKSKSARESLEKAFSEVGKTEDKGGQDAGVKAGATPAEPKKDEAKSQKTAEAKPEPKSDGQERGPDGKFVAKDAKEATDKPADTQPAQKSAGLADPPSRFSEDAKKAWAEAPESVRAETYRAIRETEQGIQQYQKAFEPIKPFLDMAKGDAQQLAAAMGRYVNTENVLRSNPVQGFSEIARNMGLSPQQVGKMLLGEEPGQADPRDQQFMAMQQELQQLRQQTGQVTQTMQEQREKAVLSQVEQFSQANPRFDELSDEIATMLSTGYAKDLQDAYDKADRLNPAPAPVVETPPPAPPAQTRPTRSLTGAPSHGSNPTTTRTPSKSPREALNRAFGA